MSETLHLPALVAHLAFQNPEMQIAVSGMSQRKEFKVVFSPYGQMANTVSDLIDWVRQDQ